MTTFNANTGLTISVKVEISNQLSKMLNVFSESLKTSTLDVGGSQNKGQMRMTDRQPVGVSMI